MEAVLPRIRISGKRSQEQQEEQQPKKAKNNDEEMDIGKVEDQEDDGYQPNKRQLPWDMVRFLSESLFRWRGKRSWILWRSSASARMPGVFRRDGKGSSGHEVG